MRFVVALCALVMWTSLALARNPKIPLLNGYLDGVDKALAQSRAGNARTLYDMVGKDLARADDALKGDPEYPALVKRYQALGAKVDAAENASNGASQADADLAEALRGAMSGRSYMSSAQGERAVERYQACVTILERVLAAYPARGKEESKANNGRTYEQELAACRKGLDEAKLWVAGGGREPAKDHELGKKAIAAYNAATVVVRGKNLDPIALIRARQQVLECYMAYHTLISNVDRSNHPYWVEDKEPMPVDGGSITLKELGTRCTAYRDELAKRTAKGCGYLEIGVHQAAMPGGGWGHPSDSIGMGWFATKCSRMPKAAHNSAPSSFHARMREFCPNGMLVSESPSWVVNADGVSRSIMTRCWAKGEINFYGIDPDED